MLATAPGRSAHERGWGAVGVGGYAASLRTAYSARRRGSAIRRTASPNTAVPWVGMARRSGSSIGEYYWGGAASTAFWVDPTTGVTASFFTQLMPSSPFPIRSELRQLVYQALV